MLNQITMDRSYAINRAHPWLILWSCFAAVSAVMVFNSLTQYLNQDEEQFITAAYLAAHMRLYADFLFLQTPIYPLVLSKLLILFSGGSPFLVGRLLSAALAISTVAVFFRLAVRLAESVQFAFILAALFASDSLDAAGLWRDAQ